MNTPRLALCVLLASFFPLLAADEPKPAAPPAVEIKQEYDVEYVPGGGKSQALDVYYPAKADKPLPIAIFIHGGGWVSGDKGGCPLVPLTQRGYVVASVNYRFSNQAIFPAQVQDCQAALRFLRANAKKYNIDPARIGVWGDSAGGHLVALLGTTGGKKAFPPIGGNEDQSDAVQAVFDWYGPTNFLTFAAQATPDDVIHADKPDSVISKLFGGTVAEHKELAISASPVHYVDKNAAPIMIEHGDKDNVVPLAQSLEFVDALKKAGADVTLNKIEGAGHGPGVNRAGFVDVIGDFFDKHLKK
jgi:acetyl esterase/lipase